MNYQHIYHAGNFADVVKHWALTLVLQKLKEKDTPFCVLDTHAGTGLYDITSAAAEKTGEAKDGIVKLLANPPQDEVFTHYLNIVKRYAPNYPGSPAIAHLMLRPQDRLVLCELHPDACADLKQHFGRDKQVAVHERDGYEGLKAFLPPKEKRGAVIIDPPYEKPDEFEQLARHITSAHARFSHGIYMIWYPLKDMVKINRFYADMSLIPKTLAVEFIHDPAATLPGCGLLFINPPWKLDETLETQLPLLLAALGKEKTGSLNLRRLGAQ